MYNFVVRNMNICDVHDNLDTVMYLSVVNNFVALRDKHFDDLRRDSDYADDAHDYLFDMAVDGALKDIGEGKAAACRVVLQQRGDDVVLGFNEAAKRVLDGEVSRSPWVTDFLEETDTGVDTGSEFFVYSPVGVDDGYKMSNSYFGVEFPEGVDERAAAVLLTDFVRGIGGYADTLVQHGVSVDCGSFYVGRSESGRVVATTLSELVYVWLLDKAGVYGFTPLSPWGDRGAYFVLRGAVRGNPDRALRFTVV